MKKVILHLKSQRYYFKEIVGFFFILLGIYFLRRERGELVEVQASLAASNFLWLLAGVLLAGIYILLQTMMYVTSFRAVGNKVSFGLALTLFLKRNLISVFLPGGGITSLLFFTKEIEKRGISKTKINFASYIYGVIGILSLVCVALPVILYLTFTHQHFGREWEAIAALLLLITVIGWLSFSLYKKGNAYRWLLRVLPSFDYVVTEVKTGAFSLRQLYGTLAYSFLIEFVGVCHLWMAMQALGFSSSWVAALVAYTIATLFLCLSPFMRGLGAVEISMVLVLGRYGFDNAQAISITFLYRFFEFWFPLIIGVFSFIFQRGSLFLRIFPSILLAFLGTVNIASVLTPAIASRVRLLQHFIPSSAMHFSNYLVLLMGVLLIICSAFLLKGLRSAWYIAMGLSVLSLFGHIFKAIDYEEASLALFTILTLAFTYKQYYIKGYRNLHYFSLATALLLLIAVLGYGTIGFYSLKVRHFSEDFTWAASFANTAACLVLLDTNYLRPRTEFAQFFVYSLNFFGVSTILLLFYTFIKPYIWKGRPTEEDVAVAKQLVDQFGNTACDYFKLAPDKSFFFGENHEGVIAYRVANNYAVVLHEPVCADDEDRKRLIKAFEKFCLENSLKVFYYRIDEERLPFFIDLGKKALPIGQEAIVDIQGFTLEGKDRKSMRNAVNSIHKKGYSERVYLPPIKEGLLQKLRQVSDDWLESMHREEIVFSQGLFDEKTLKEHTILTLENADEKVIAFLNIIPDYKQGELTYDLIRKTADAPNGNMDALLVALLNYGKEQGFYKLNMGLAPFSGIDRASDLPQRTVKFAYERLQQFKHYKGLRDFKEKFDPEWQTKYLVFSHHYDLLQAPVTLSKIIKP